MSSPPSSPHNQRKQAYQQAGVSLDTADAVVSLAKQAAATTTTAPVPLLGRLGGFSGAFQLPAGLTDPVLLAACDGVGTKLALAHELDRWDTVGIDLVAMSVNDLLCQGGQPLVFLDYLAGSHLQPAQLQAVLAGVADGCRQAGCVLLGGETAEMPGFYPAGQLELAGFCLGVVEKAAMLPQPTHMHADDVLLGLPSNGFHSNGYSLIRKGLADGAFRLDDLLPDGTPLGQALLAPTRVYVSPVLQLLQAAPGALTGLAHITGGGLYDNVNRCLPNELQAVLDPASWPLPPVMQAVQQAMALDDPTLWQTFNAGLGLVMVVPTNQAETVQALWQTRFSAEHGPLYRVGQLRQRAPQAPAVHVERGTLK